MSHRGLAVLLASSLCLAPLTAKAADAEPQKTESRSDGAARVAGWVVVSVGVEAAVVATVTSFMMLHRDSVRSDNCDASKHCTEAGIEANNALRSLGPWNAGAWALAAVGIGVGAWLVLSNPPDDGVRTAIGVGPGGVGLRGSF